MVRMSDINALSERIDALEMRLAYQDETIETLNQTITAQWKQIDALTRQLAELKERLQEAESNAVGPGQRTTAALLNRHKKTASRRRPLRSNRGCVRSITHANQTARTTATATIAAHTTGETSCRCRCAALIGRVIELGFHRGPAFRCQRKIARILSHKRLVSRSPSAFDGAGCAALTGSEAGKVPTSPFSSFSCISRSARIASRGSAACLSCAAGLNFSAIGASIARNNVPD